MASKKKPNVIIGIGCQDTVYAKTMHSIACNVIKAGGIVSDILMRQGGDIVSARTWLVREALKKGATHLLFVDSDMLFPPDALNKLLAHDKDIVGVRYHRRKFPLEQTHKPLTELSENETTLFRCDYVGTGLMLIKLSILKDIDEPWFNFGRDAQGALVISEDVWFCKTAQDAGFSVWADPTIKVGHIGNYTF